MSPPPSPAEQPRHNRRATVAAPAGSPERRDIGSAEKICQAAPGVSPHPTFHCSYFGCTFGSPPGLPGGGMTGVLPPPGGGLVIPGSTLGGQNTPSLRASLSLRFSFRALPVVLGSVLPGSLKSGDLAEGSTWDIA